MSTIQRGQTPRLIACLGAVIAAGCGGGSDEVLTPPPPELLQITSGNQVAVAGATAMNFSILDSLRDVPTAAASGAPQARGTADPVKHALGRSVARIARAVPLGTISVTEPCPFSGSIAITLDDRDNNAAPSPGDVLTSVFNDCREEASSLINGSFAVNIAGYSNSLLSGLFTFSALTVADADGTITMSGQADLAYAVSSDSAGTWTTRIEMKVAPAGLGASISSPQYRETFNYDADFGAQWTDVSPVAASGYSTSVLNGKFLAASLGAKTIVATDPPIRDVWVDDGPQSGAALITGHQSRLRMTVVSTTTARLELDANNDGTFEETRDIPWSELLPIF